MTSENRCFEELKIFITKNLSNLRIFELSADTFLSTLITLLQASLKLGNQPGAYRGLCFRKASRLIVTLHVLQENMDFWIEMVPQLSVEEKTLFNDFLVQEYIKEK